jgi:hypothetical protein
VSDGVAISIVTLSILLSMGATDDSAERMPDLLTIASAVRAQEGLLLNLQVAVHRDWERWSDDAGEWTYAGEADLRAWLTGESNSKVRIDCEREVIQWVDGPAPFSENSYRVSFNGQATKRLQTRTGVAGSPSDVLTGELTAGPAPDMEDNGGAQTGWQFTPLGVRRNEPLSDYLTALADGRLSVQVLRGEVGRGPSVAVRVHEPDGQQRTFHFDPESGYALVGAEFRFPNGALGERWTAHELGYLAPGFYYPTVVVRELFTGEGSPRERSTFYASEIVANDPAWTDDVFDPEWPPGTVVNDKIAGTVYQVGPSPQQLQAAVDEQIGSLLAEMRPQRPTPSHPDQIQATIAAQEPASPPPASRPAPPAPATKPVARPSTRPTTQSARDEGLYAVKSPKPAHDDRDTLVSAPQTPSDSPPPRSQYPELLIVLLGAGALAVVAVVLAKGKRAGPLVLLICAGLPRSAAGDDRLLPLSLPQLGHQKLNNCGLNAAVFVCRHFQVPSAVDALAAELGVGNYYQRPASLLGLKQVFTARGLSVEAYRDARFEEVANALDGTALWLLHVNKSPESLGHFYILAGQDPSRICWIDPVRTCEWTSSTNLTVELEGKFQGWCLRIAPPEPGACALRLVNDTSGVAWFPDRVNLGVVTPEQVSRATVTIAFVVADRAAVCLTACTDGLELARECIERESRCGTEFSETRTYSFRLRERGVGPIDEALTFRSTPRDQSPIVIPVRGRVRVPPVESVPVPR